LIDRNFILDDIPIPNRTESVSAQQ